MTSTEMNALRGYTARFCSLARPLGPVVHEFVLRARRRKGSSLDFRIPDRYLNRRPIARVAGANDPPTRSASNFRNVSDRVTQPYRSRDLLLFEGLSRDHKASIATKLRDRDRDRVLHRPIRARRLYWFRSLRVCQRSRSLLFPLERTAAAAKGTHEESNEKRNKQGKNRVKLGSAARND